MAAFVVGSGGGGREEHVTAVVCRGGVSPSSWRDEATRGSRFSRGVVGCALSFCVRSVSACVVIACVRAAAASHVPPAMRTSFIKGFTYQKNNDTAHGRHAEYIYV